MSTPRVYKTRVLSGAERQRRHRRKAQRERLAAELQDQRDKRGIRELDMADRERLASELAGLPLFGCIYADPPWAFDLWSHDTGTGRTAVSHYNTMPQSEICALPVPAASDCVLFLWATGANMPEAHAVMSAWSFHYRQQIVWVKPSIGLGRWIRNRHELLLIGTRGNVPAPAPGTQPPSVIEAPTSRHSAKPPEFAALIERMFPSLSRLEMFSRTPRPGWTAWGAEAAPPSAMLAAAAD